MQTIDTNDLVSDPANDITTGSFEACGEFAGSPDASPICAGCGWLDTEHAPAIAEVHALAARRRTPAAPKRLAS